MFLYNYKCFYIFYSVLEVLFYNELYTKDSLYDNNMNSKRDKRLDFFLLNIYLRDLIKC